MAGMTAKNKGNKRIFTFSGDLEKCIEKCEKELKTKEESQERIFLKWQRDKAVKAYDSYERRITDLRSFLSLARKDLEERSKHAE